MESARGWSRCRHCGFRCFRVWDRRAKRVRDLGVSGRRTTLVWCGRRFECGNCGDRHLEDHALFQAGLSRRFARRLVADATVMSIRAVGRHHGVGWHRIMGLVRAHSERVVQRRRARPCRVLLVDETSIRRRHRYVTVVASGDSGQVLAMIPGRTKASLARFFRDQGAWWCRQVEIVVPIQGPAHTTQTIDERYNNTYPTLAMCSTGSTSYAGSPKASPRSLRRENTTPREPTHRRNQQPPPSCNMTPHRASPNVRAGPVPSPLHPPTPNRPPHRSGPTKHHLGEEVVDRIFDAHPSASPNRVRMPSSRALPTTGLRSRQPGPGQPGARTVR